MYLKALFCATYAEALTVCDVHVVVIWSRQPPCGLFTTQREMKRFAEYGIAVLMNSKGLAEAR